ncbi:hypothetical protein B0G77_0587 [Paraburkholderia sp. BL10I2N1]|nr:hypothetical protein B0G77_0587 [Paraburkholderia sp. BL10I2N1]
MSEKTGDSPPSPPAPPKDTESSVPLRDVGATRLSWRRTTRWAKRIVAATTTLSTLAFVGWIVGLTVAATLRGHSLDLQAITVPKTLADDGFSTVVITQRLRDAINAVHERTYPRVAKTGLGTSPRLAGHHDPEGGGLGR